jgi:hypothetical protein
MNRTYLILGVDTAMRLLRPGAKWEISGTEFTRWDDPRSCPTWDEVVETVHKIKAFEDTIDTIWLPEQIAKADEDTAMIERALGA